MKHRRTETKEDATAVGKARADAAHACSAMPTLMTRSGNFFWKLFSFDDPIGVVDHGDDAKSTSASCSRVETQMFRRPWNPATIRAAGLPSDQFLHRLFVLCHVRDAV